MEDEPINQIKKLGETTEVIRKVFNSSRMNQYVILFDMLNDPTIRYSTKDYLGILSDETAYIMQSFKMLKQRNFVEVVEVFGKEKAFEVPVMKFEEARDFLIDRVMTYLKNKVKEGENIVTYAEVVMAFRKMLCWTPKTILKHRLQRIENQIEAYPNEAIFRNIKNKLVEQKDLFRDENGNF